VPAIEKIGVELDTATIFHDCGLKIANGQLAIGVIKKVLQFVAQQIP